MNFTEFNEEIISRCSFLTVDNFVLKELPTKRNSNYWYVKGSFTGGYGIGFSYTEYDDFHVRAINCRIRFNEVEAVMNQLLGGDLNTSYTIQKFLGDQTFFIKSISDLDNLLIKLNDFYHNQAIPFFKQYCSIGDVNKSLNEIDRSKIGQFLCGVSNSGFYRELIVKKFSSDSTYDSYYAYILNELLPFEEQKTFRDIILNLKKLKNYLDSAHK